jgi:hypothetical protein
LNIEAFVFLHRQPMKPLCTPPYIRRKRVANANKEKNRKDCAARARRKHADEDLAAKVGWQEHQLVHNRLSWLLTSQTILFAGYAVAYRSVVTESRAPAGLVPAAIAFADDPVDPLSRLYLGIPWVGLGLCCAVAIGVWAAVYASYLYGGRCREKGTQFGISVATDFFGWLPALFIPMIFASAWGWLMDTYFGLIVVAAGYVPLFGAFCLVVMAINVVADWLEPTEPPQAVDRACCSARAGRHRDPSVCGHEM